MFLLPKHNIVREVHNGSLSSEFLVLLCKCVHLQYVCGCACVWKCVAMTAPLNPPSLVHKRVGPSSWSPFKVRLEFLKDTLPVNFTSLFMQRISLLTFSPASPSSRQLQKPWASSFDNDRGPWKERKRQKKELQHTFGYIKRDSSAI